MYYLSITYFILFYFIDSVTPSVCVIIILPSKQTHLDSNSVQDLRC
jgi:hypothetical protein